MNAQLIWKDASPRCKFIFEPTDDSASKIYCTIENYQEKYKELCETLQVALNQKKLKCDVCCKCLAELRCPNTHTVYPEETELEDIAGSSFQTEIDATAIIHQQEMEPTESIEEFEEDGYAVGETNTNVQVSILF